MKFTKEQILEALRASKNAGEWNAVCDQAKVDGVYPEWVVRRSHPDRALHQRSNGLEMSFQIQPGPIYRSVKPVRSPEYRRFIKRLPCAACLATWNVDPCHTGPHGLSQKSSDMSCIPLCRRCHDAFDADPHGFAARHKMDVPALIKKFNSFYREKINPQEAA